MTTLLIALAAVTATGAAIRSTWSPCGLSMLSTITPMAERSRNRRWGLTAAWFLSGAVLGGAVLGAGAALLALVERAQIAGLDPEDALRRATEQRIDEVRASEAARDAER